MLRLNIWLRRRLKKSTWEEELSKENIKIPSIIERAQEFISEDLGLSLMKLVKTLSVSDTTMHRIAEEDLRFKSYVIKVRQMLSEIQN